MGLSVIHYFDQDCTPQSISVDDLDIEGYQRNLQADGITVLKVETVADAIDPLSDEFLTLG